MKNSSMSQWLFAGFLAIAAIVPVINLNRYIDGILSKDAFFVFMICIMAVAWAWRGSRPAYVNRQFMLILLFLGIVGLSALVSGDLYTSLVGDYRHWEGIAAYIALALTYFLALQVDWDDDKIRKLMLVLTTVAAVVAALALLKFSYEYAQLETMRRQSESFFGPNALSFFLIMVWPLALRLFIAAKNKLEKATTLLSCVLIFAGNIVTLSRSGWVISAIMLVAVVIVSGRVKRILIPMAAALVIIVLAALISKPLAESLNFSNRFMSIFQSESIASRVALWRESKKLIADKPLTGYGPDSFGTVHLKYEEPRVAIFLRKPRTAHNWLFNNAVNFGLPALLLMAAIFLWAVFDGFRSRNYYKQSLSLGLISAMLLGLTLEWHPFLMVLFWLFMGIAGAGKVAVGAGRHWIKPAILVVGSVLLVGLCYISVADYYYKLGMRAEGRKAKIVYFHRAVKLNPYVYEYWHKSIKANIAESDDQRLFLIKQAQAYLPGREEFILDEANLELARRAEEPDKILALIDKAIKMRPLSSEARYFRSRVLMRLKRYEEAEAEFRTVVDLMPFSAQVHYLRGRVLMKLKRFDEAEAEFNTVIGLKPSLARAHYFLGRVLMKLKRFEEAEAEFSIAVKSKPFVKRVKKSRKEMVIEQ